MPITPLGAQKTEAMALVKELLAFTRYQQWHYGKIPLLLTLLFTLHLQTPQLLTVAVTIRWYMILSLFLALAYMLNNLSDFEVDSQVGKALALRTWPTQARWGVTLGTGMAGFFLGRVFLNGWALIALGHCYFLAWIYSFPPRFKENVWLGPLIAAIGQLVAPALVLLVAYRQVTATELCYLALLLLWGLRMILVHQILDRVNDAAAGVSTTVVVIGLERAHRLLWVFFSGEVVLVSLQIVLLLRSGLHWVTLVFLLFELASFLAMKRRGGGLRLDTYDYIPLVDVYEMILPLMLAVSLTIYSGGKLWWSVLLIVLLFGRRYLERFATTYFSLAEA